MAAVTNYQAGGSFLPAVPARVTSNPPWNFDVAPTVGTDAGQGAQTIVTDTSTQTLTNKTLTTPTIASSSGIPYVSDATGAGSKKIAMGTGTLVTGTLLVATGLAGVTSFVAVPTSQPTGTGAASNQILVPTFTGTTGAVTVTAYSISSVTGATAASSTATGVFAYIASGT